MVMRVSRATTRVSICACYSAVWWGSAICMVPGMSKYGLYKETL